MSMNDNGDRISPKVAEASTHLFVVPFVNTRFMLYFISQQPPGLTLRLIFASVLIPAASLCFNGTSYFQEMRP